MSIKSWIMAALVVASPLSAYADAESNAGGGGNEQLTESSDTTLECAPGAGVYGPGVWGTGGYNSCYNYNRDGISCSQVGFFEGQVGAPWGGIGGHFRCTTGCLQWVGW